jgi:hypothetical protein
VASNEPGNDKVEKAMRLFVYGPIGLVSYVKDSAPTLMEVFVSRGRREVDGARRVLDEKLGRAKPAPEASPTVQQRVAGGIGKVATQAGSVGMAMAGRVVNAAAPPPPNTSTTASGNGATSSDDLPIPGYDLLSASQVIERLEGLSRGALERIRGYELAHRARRTILASIEQLTS